MNLNVPCIFSSVNYLFMQVFPCSINAICPFSNWIVLFCFYSWVLMVLHISYIHVKYMPCKYFLLHIYENFLIRGSWKMLFLFPWSPLMNLKSFLKTSLHHCNYNGDERKGKSIVFNTITAWRLCRPSTGPEPRTVVLNHPNASSL